MEPEDEPGCFAWAKSDYSGRPLSRFGRISTNKSRQIDGGDRPNLKMPFFWGVLVWDEVNVDVCVNMWENEMNVL